MDVLAAVVGALPQGLALLLGVGAAAYLALRSSRGAGIALGVGVVVLGLDVLVSVLVFPGLFFAASTGLLTADLLNVSLAATRLLSAFLRGLGVVMLLAAAAIGPAPARAEEAE